MKTHGLNFRGPTRIPPEKRTPLNSDLYSLEPPQGAKMVLQLEMNYAEIARDFFGDTSIREMLIKSPLNRDINIAEDEDDIGII